jgi:hypothetical protein
MIGSGSDVAGKPEAMILPLKAEGKACARSRRQRTSGSAAFPLYDLPGYAKGTRDVRKGFFQLSENEKYKRIFI